MKKEYKKMNKCRLCGLSFPESEMSEEHYPAKNTGNYDIVAINIVDLFDLFINQEKQQAIRNRLNKGESLEDVAGEIFDSELAIPVFPKGRTARTLCRNCNTFLGKYDEAYLKFYNNNGDPSVIKGYQRSTKLRMIKAIFAKFLSIPEAQNEDFDFIDFIRNEEIEEYKGKWSLFFIKRDASTDLMGMPDIQTGKLEYKNGTVYEFSDQKFIFDLLNFQLLDDFEMTSIFDILKKDYHLVTGMNTSAGFHAQIVIGNTFQDLLGDKE